MSKKQRKCVRFSKTLDFAPAPSFSPVIEPYSSAFGPDYSYYTRAVGYVPLYSSTRRPYHSEPRHRGNYLFSAINMHFLTAALKNLEPRIDDDLIDRLNYYYTPSVIVVFAILVSAKQYVGHPIECWVPAQFTRAMEQYTENYCWVQNTYWIPFSDLIPTLISQRERRQIGYYQWVPFILAIQALMFYVPAITWRILSTQSGINVHGILQMVSDEHNVEPENRLRTAHILARHIDDALRYQRDFGAKRKPIYLFAFVRMGKHYGAYVSMVYCFVKLLYLGNLIGQFILLNRVLETDQYPYYGANVLWDLLHGNEWQNSGKFPRVTLCDFEIRVLGNIHRHTVQCVLVINLFTEKIFIFLWLWMVLLGTLCILSFCYWITSLMLPSLRVTFIRHHLELTDNAPRTLRDGDKLRNFVLDFLRPDGVFILRMINWHGGTVLCTEITNILWTRFRESKDLKPPEIPKEMKRPSLIISSSMQDLMDQGLIFEDRQNMGNALQVPNQLGFRKRSKSAPSIEDVEESSEEDPESDPDEIVLQVPSIRPQPAEPSKGTTPKKTNSVAKVSKKLKSSLSRKTGADNTPDPNKEKHTPKQKKSAVFLVDQTSQIV